jgi:hypothetical protein
MGDLEKGDWIAEPSTAWAPWWIVRSGPGADDDLVYVTSRQDCDDLIELLRVVRERLP